VAGIGRNRNPEPIERDWSTPRFLFVGKDWGRKNGAAVVRSFARLRERFQEARLDVVGNHPPLDDRGVTGHGMLRDAVPAENRRLEELYQRATCFVMPSHHEPAGIVYVEAAATGIASIGTTSGGARDLIGDAGILVDPSSDDALFQAMSTMADPETASRLGGKALVRSRLFTWEQVSERLLRAFQLPQVDSSELAEFL
jgi:glycosyltransferase involved in cell wall biosynthesis